MANKKTSELDPVGGPLDGTEIVAVVKAGANVRTTAQAIADLVTNERIDDRVAGLLVQGSGITLTYDDASNTLTISASGTASAPTTLAFTSAAVAGSVLQADKAGTVLRATDASAANLTIQTAANVAIPVNSVFSVRQAGDGKITVIPIDGTVVLNIPTGMLAATRAKGSVLMLHKVGTNTWDVTGDLATA